MTLLEAAPDILYYGTESEEEMYQMYVLDYWVDQQDQWELYTTVFPDMSWEEWESDTDSPMSYQDWYTFLRPIK